MTRWLGRLLDAITDTDVPVIGPQPTVIGPTPPTTVEPPPRFAWDEKRWHRQTDGQQTELEGQYRVFDRHQRSWRQFAGRIVERHKQIAAYIADPPLEMKRHRHGPCLQLVRAPWFRLHWSTQPKTLDDALIYVERMLDESFNNGRR